MFLLERSYSFSLGENVQTFLTTNAISSAFVAVSQKLPNAVNCVIGSFVGPMVTPEIRLFVRYIIDDRNIISGLSLISFHLYT